MAVKCEAILDLALEEISKADSEVRFRNIIGRAYYASFHKATAYHTRLSDQGMSSPEKVGRHRGLSYALEHPTISNPDSRKTSRQMGYICRDLHAKRVDTDYEIGRDITKRIAEQAIEQAQLIFKLSI